MGEGDFVSRVQRRAAVLAARSGMSFAAADRCLRLCQSAIDDIIGVKGIFDGPGARAALTRAVSEDDRAAAAVLLDSDPTRFGAIATRLTTEPTSGMKDVAKMVQQLESIRKRTNRRGHNGYDGGVRQHRTTISKRISDIADFVRLEVATLVANGCPFVGLMVDESQSRSQTDPCYVAIIFCTIDFKFGHHIVGQTDAANGSDGVSLAQQVEGVLTQAHEVQGQAKTWLLDRVTFVGSDGASAMRSSRKYAGLSIRSGPTPKERGTSMLASLQHSLASRRGTAHIPFTGFHCMLHILSLSLGDIMQLLPPFVIPMARGIVSYFKRSPVMFARLKKEGSAANEAIAAIEAELNVERGADVAISVRAFKQYCPTRWVGLATTIRSVLGNWLPLRELKLSLTGEGYGAPDNDDRSWGGDVDGEEPDDSDIDDNHDGAAQDVDGRESTSDTEDIDINGISMKWRRGNGDNAVDWEHLVAADERVGDTGHNGAHPVADAHSLVPAAKRSVLLSDARGITDMNWALLSMLVDYLAPSEVLIGRLQNRVQPIQHRAYRWITSFRRELRMRWVPPGGGGSPLHGPRYNAVCDALGQMSATAPMLIEVEDLARRLAVGQELSMQARLDQPGYTDMLKAMELADPSMEIDAEYTDAVWDKVMLLCSTAGIDYNQLKDETTTFHSQHQGRTVEQKKWAQQNLLKFYHNLAKDGGLQQYPTVAAYARAVFSCPITTVFVEALFGGMGFIKSDHRASLEDAKVVDVLTLGELEPVCPDKYVEGPEPGLRLDTHRALENVLVD